MSAKENRKNALKQLLDRLHQGEDVEKIKKEFVVEFGEASPEEIARIEEELIADGMSITKLRKLCDVHIEVFKESLNRSALEEPLGHPIRILKDEHRLMLEHAETFAKTLKLLSVDTDETRIRSTTNRFEAVFKDAEKHYLREENVLFPMLEKHGIKQPPAIMWIEHDKIRELKKEIYSLTEAINSEINIANFERLKAFAGTLVETLSSHFYKENQILYPTAMNVVTSDEWDIVLEDFRDIGFCKFSILDGLPEKPSSKIPEPLSKNMLALETGSFKSNELQNFLNALPIDITFVNKDDEVQYFNQPADRFFPRTKAVLGRLVKNCHPQKSAHIVLDILDSFRKGTQDFAEFWLNLNEKFLHIRYFAVRDSENNYLGCAEMMQDVAGIRALKGEHKLLEWTK